MGAAHSDDPGGQKLIYLNLALCRQCFKDI